MGDYKEPLKAVEALLNVDSKRQSAQQYHVDNLSQCEMMLHALLAEVGDRKRKATEEFNAPEREPPLPGMTPPGTEAVMTETDAARGPAGLITAGDVQEGEFEVESDDPPGELDRELAGNEGETDGDQVADSQDSDAGNEPEIEAKS